MAARISAVPRAQAAPAPSMQKDRTMPPDGEPEARNDVELGRPTMAGMLASQTALANSMNNEVPSPVGSGKEQADPNAADENAAAPQSKGKDKRSPSRSLFSRKDRPRSAPPLRARNPFRKEASKQQQQREQSLSTPEKPVTKEMAQALIAEAENQSGLHKSVGSSKSGVGTIPSETAPSEDTTEPHCNMVDGEGGKIPSSIEAKNKKSEKAKNRQTSKKSKEVISEEKLNDILLENFVMKTQNKILANRVAQLEEETQQICSLRSIDEGDDEKEEENDASFIQQETLRNQRLMLEQVQSELAETSQDRAELRVELEEQRIRSMRLEKDIDVLTSETKGLQLELGKSLEANEKIKKERKETQAKNETLARRLGDAKRKIKSMRRKAEETEAAKAIGEGEGEGDDNDKEKERKRRERRMKDELKVAKKDAEKKIRKIVRMELELEAARDELVEVKMVHGRDKADAEALKREVERLKGGPGPSPEEIQSMQKDLVTLIHENARLRSELETARSTPSSAPQKTTGA